MYYVFGQLHAWRLSQSLHLYEAAEWICRYKRMNEINTVLTTETCSNVICLCITEVLGLVVTSQAKPPTLNTMTRLYVPGTYSAPVRCPTQLRTHTHAHTDTHLCTAETHHYRNTGALSESSKVQNVHVSSTEGQNDCLGARPKDWAFCVSRELPWPPW